MDKPRVKPLAWEDFDGRGAKAAAWRKANYLITGWSDGRFQVVESYPGYQGDSIGAGFYPTLEAAKAAAEADYESRILAALEPAPVSVQEAARVLGALPPNELRPILSNLANMTPDVVYYPNDFLSGFPDKKDGEGTSMGKTGQAALFLANSLAEHIEPGGEAVIRLGSISHGNQNNGDWTVTVLRALAGDEGER